MAVRYRRGRALKDAFISILKIDPGDPFFRELGVAVWRFQSQVLQVAHPANVRRQQAETVVVAKLGRHKQRPDPGGTPVIGTETGAQRCSLPPCQHPHRMVQEGFGQVVKVPAHQSSVTQGEEVEEAEDRDKDFVREMEQLEAG